MQPSSSAPADHHRLWQNRYWRTNRRCAFRFKGYQKHSHHWWCGLHVSTRIKRLGCRSWPETILTLSISTSWSCFSGSFLVRKLVILYPEYNIYVVDKLDYCGSLHNLKAIKEFPNYTFIKVSKAWVPPLQPLTWHLTAYFMIRGTLHHRISCHLYWRKRTLMWYSIWRHKPTWITLLETRLNSLGKKQVRWEGCDVLTHPSLIETMWWEPTSCWKQQRLTRSAGSFTSAQTKCMAKSLAG